MNTIIKNCSDRGDCSGELFQSIDELAKFRGLDKEIDDGKDETGFLRKPRNGDPADGGTMNFFDLLVPHSRFLISNPKTHANFSRFTKGLEGFLKANPSANPRLLEAYQRAIEVVKESQDARIFFNSFQLKGEYDKAEWNNDEYVLSVENVKPNFHSERILQVSLNLNPEPSGDWEGGKWEIGIDERGWIQDEITFEPKAPIMEKQGDQYIKVVGGKKLTIFSLRWVKDESPVIFDEGEKYPVKYSLFQVHQKLSEVFREILASEEGKKLPPFQQILLEHIAFNLQLRGEGKAEKLFSDTGSTRRR